MIEERAFPSISEVSDFFDKQLSLWEEARLRFEGLKKIELKDLSSCGINIKAQFNPSRIVSTGAKVDKFKEMHLTKEKGKFVKCPLIKESPVSIECKVVEIKELGSHDMFMAEILSIDADEKYIDNKGAFDITKCDLITYANGKYFTLGKQVGKFGYSVQKKKRRN